MQFLYVFQVNGYLSAFWADSDFRLLHSSSPPFVFIVCQHQAIGCSFDFNATIINHFRITSNASTHSNLQFELKYATVIFSHCVEADCHSYNDTRNQFDHAYNNKYGKLYVFVDKEQCSEHDE